MRLGVIGCGRIAQLVHLPALRRLPGVTVAALADPDPAQRFAAARLTGAANGRRGVRLFATAEELLAEAGVEAVVICAPPAEHAALAAAAFDRGLHVYLEKPLAVSLEDACAAVAAWQRAGRAGMMGFNYRFNALYQALGRAVRAGEAGEPVVVRTVFATPARPLPRWKQRRETGGGVLLDLASHHVDLVRALFHAEVRAVWAAVQSHSTEADTAWLHLRLSNGLEVQSFFSLTAGDHDRVEVVGTGGVLAVDRYRSWNVERAEPFGAVARLRHRARSVGQALRSPYLRQKLTAPAQEPSYAAALRRFVLSVRQAEAAPSPAAAGAAAQAQAPASTRAPDLYDGLASLAVVLAAEESARTGRSVTLDGPHA